MGISSFPPSVPSPAAQTDVPAEPTATPHQNNVENFSWIRALGGSYCADYPDLSGDEQLAIMRRDFQGLFLYGANMPAEAGFMLQWSIGYRAAQLLLSRISEGGCDAMD